MIFRKVWESDTQYRIEQIRDDGDRRFVDEDYGQYVAWLNAGNTPEDIPPGPSYPETLEDKWELIRNRRNRLLQDSDWTQLADVPLTQDKVILWREYRQSLRDITLQQDPENIVWPLDVTE